MTDWHPRVVTIGQVLPHPNADSLSFTNVDAYPVVFRTGDYRPGDRALYVPVDSVADTARPEFAFLGRHPRVKAKRLRGMFSMGLLAPAPADLPEGDVTDPSRVGLSRYEDTSDAERAEMRAGAKAPSAPPPPYVVHRYDVESYRRWPRILQPGELVAVTEKVHGSNARYTHDGSTFYVGTRGRWLPDGDAGPHAGAHHRMAEQHELARKLASRPGLVVWAEIFGPGCQDLHYGQTEPSMVVFDLYDAPQGRFLDWQSFRMTCQALGLPRAPVLAEGPWAPELLQHAEGATTVGGGHVREGIVIRPQVERWHAAVGRVQLKHVGEGYYLRGAK